MKGEGRSRPRISLIVAVARNGVIGKDGKLPWHLPEDLKRFKALTMGHHIIMGRKTWESPGHPLPGRTSIVVTRQPEYQAAGAVVVRSLEEALRYVAPSDSEPFIIGGGEIFAQALPHVARMYLTIVHATVEGDAYFPRFDEREWRVCEEWTHPADEKHAHAFAVRTLERTLVHE